MLLKICAFKISSAHYVLHILTHFYLPKFAFDFYSTPPTSLQNNIFFSFAISGIWTVFKLLGAGQQIFACTTSKQQWKNDTHYFGTKIHYMEMWFNQNEAT